MKPSSFFGIAISVTVLAATTVLIVLAIGRIDLRPRTDDAYLQADLVHLASQVSGQIVQLAVSDNAHVRRGDVLFVIDQEPYRDKVAQAKAELDSVRAQLAVGINQVASQSSRAQAAAMNVRSADAQRALAQLSLSRLAPLGAQGFVPAERVDQARTAARTAQVSSQSAREEAQAASQAVTSVQSLEAQVQAARATLALAERDLRLTVVKAPCDGQVTSLGIAEGEYAVTGQPVFTLIDTERWYAVGNFRETDLAGLRPGQGATVFVLGFEGQALHGVINSLGGGVTPDEGTSGSSGLPSVPRSLNWVRIAQRFPVRVLIDHPPEAMMRIGATVVVLVQR